LGATLARYASETSVSVEASRAEIERTLRRYKADAFAYASEGRRATIMFQISGRRVRFILTLPDPASKVFTEHSRGKRSADAAEKMWEQACRQLWRALNLVIKAKLEAVAAGITTIEDEFLAHTMLPNGSTVGEWVQPEVAEAYLSNSMPKFLAIEGPRH
jgi:hypothetical protein